jgi:hybrid cluster-associated redox disulfide protein
MQPIDIKGCQSVDEVMRLWPSTISIFVHHRMACVGCAIGPYHTIEEASAEYGLVVAAFVDELRVAARAVEEVP